MNRYRVDVGVDAAEAVEAEANTVVYARVPTVEALLFAQLPEDEEHPPAALDSFVAQLLQAIGQNAQHG